jgi:hypothetical protein
VYAVASKWMRVFVFLKKITMRIVSVSKGPLVQIETTLDGKYI